jgi:hypothetical protein
MKKLYLFVLTHFLSCLCVVSESSNRWYESDWRALVAMDGESSRSPAALQTPPSKQCQRSPSHGRSRVRIGEIIVCEVVREGSGGVVSYPAPLVGKTLLLVHFFLYCWRTRVRLQ